MVKAKKCQYLYGNGCADSTRMAPPPSITDEVGLERRGGKNVLKGLRRAGTKFNGFERICWKGASDRPMNWQYSGASLGLSSNFYLFRYFFAQRNHPPAFHEVPEEIRQQHFFQDGCWRFHSPWPSAIFSRPFSGSMESSILEQRRDPS